MQISMSVPWTQTYAPMEFVKICAAVTGVTATAAMNQMPLEEIVSVSSLLYYTGDFCML